MSNSKYIIGIDEAGRGPLAGPVAVGVSLVSEDFDWSLIVGVGDSKKISPKKREVIFEQTILLKSKGLVDFAVVMISARTIDKIGIVPAIKQALSKGLKKLMSEHKILPSEVTVKLDGGLKAPADFLNQETIIKGDDKELSIGLASIMAKVTRDRYMVKQSSKPEYEMYNFELHKGYGTKVHRASIEKHGLSKEHRASFCRNITIATETT